MRKAVFKNEKTGKCFMMLDDKEGNVHFFPVYLSHGEKEWKLSKSAKGTKYTVVDLEAIVRTDGSVYFKEKFWNPNSSTDDEVVQKDTEPEEVIDDLPF